jgi:hypothetical protein
MSLVRLCSRKPNLDIIPGFNPDPGSIRLPSVSNQRMPDNISVSSKQIPVYPPKAINRNQPESQPHHRQWHGQIRN